MYISFQSNYQNMYKTHYCLSNLTDTKYETQPIKAKVDNKQLI